MINRHVKSFCFILIEDSHDVLMKAEKKEDILSTSDFSKIFNALTALI